MDNFYEPRNLKMFEDTSTNVHLVLVQGPPNSGKTHVLRQRYPAAYWKAPYTKDWHGYTSQTVAIVDNIIWPIPKVSTTTFAFEHLLQVNKRHKTNKPHPSFRSLTSQDASFRTQALSKWKTPPSRRSSSSALATGRNGSLEPHTTTSTSRC